MEDPFSVENYQHYSVDDEHLYDPFDYLTAVNISKLLMSRQIPVSELGYSELLYPFSDEKNANKLEKKKRKVESLRAIIPSTSQKEILQQLKGSQTLQDTLAARRPSIFPKQQDILASKTRPGSAALFVGAKMQPEKKPAKIRRDEDGKPVYMEVPKGKKKVYDLLKQHEEEKQQRKKHMQTLSKYKSGDEFVGEEGAAYFYGENGRKVSAEELVKEEEERKRRIAAMREKDKQLSMWNVLHSEEPKKVLLGELAHKTKEWVKETQVLAAEVAKAGKSRGFQDNPSTTFALKNGMPVLPKEAVKMWPEYAQLEPEDVIVTVEYCKGCAEHQWGTHHDEEAYFSLAEDIQFILTQLAEGYAIRFAALMKPITAEQSRRKKGEYVIPQFVMGVDVTKRTGAMEVQMAVRTATDTVVHILHSKLFRECWPNLSVVRRIAEAIFSQLGLKRFKRGDTDGTATIDGVVDGDRPLSRSLSQRSSSLKSLNAGSKTARKLQDALKKSSISSGGVTAQQSPAKPKPQLPYVFDRRAETLRQNRLNLMDDLLHVSTTSRVGTARDGIAHQQEVDNAAAATTTATNIVTATNITAALELAGGEFGEQSPASQLLQQPANDTATSTLTTAIAIATATLTDVTNGVDLLSDDTAPENGDYDKRIESSSEDAAERKSAVSFAGSTGIDREDVSEEGGDAIAVADDDGHIETNNHDKSAGSGIAVLSTMVAARTGIETATEEALIVHHETRSRVIDSIEPEGHHHHLSTAAAVPVPPAPVVTSHYADHINEKASSATTIDGSVAAAVASRPATGIILTTTDPSPASLPAADESVTHTAIPTMEVAVAVVQAVPAGGVVAVDRRSSINSSFSSFSDADFDALAPINNHHNNQSVQSIITDALREQTERESVGSQKNDSSTSTAAVTGTGTAAAGTATGATGTAGGAAGTGTGSRGGGGGANPGRNTDNDHNRLDEKTAAASAVTNPNSYTIPNDTNVTDSAEEKNNKKNAGMLAESRKVVINNHSSNSSSNGNTNAIDAEATASSGSSTAAAATVPVVHHVKTVTTEPPHVAVPAVASIESMSGSIAVQEGSSNSSSAPNTAAAAAAAAATMASAAVTVAVAAPSFESTFSKIIQDSEQRISAEVHRNSDFNLKILAARDEEEKSAREDQENDANRPVPTQQLLNELQDLLHCQSSASSDVGDDDEIDYYGDVRTSSRRSSLFGRRASTDSALASVKEDGYEDDFEPDQQDKDSTVDGQGDNNYGVGGIRSARRRASQLLAKRVLEKGDEEEEDEEDKYSDDFDHVATSSNPNSASTSGKLLAASSATVTVTAAGDDTATSTSGSSNSRTSLTDKTSGTAASKDEKSGISSSNGESSSARKGSQPTSQLANSTKKNGSRSQSRRSSRDDGDGDDDEMDLNEALFGRKRSLKPKGGGASPVTAAVGGGGRKGGPSSRVMNSVSTTSLDDDFLDDLSFDARLLQFGNHNPNPNPKVEPGTMVPEGVSGSEDDSSLSARGSTQGSEKKKS